MKNEASHHHSNQPRKKSFNFDCKDTDFLSIIIISGIGAMLGIIIGLIQSMP